MSDYDLIKGRLDLLAVISAETGLGMKGHHLEECPFCHGHGCFSVKESFYKCFQCDAGGDVFTFLESFHKLDKPEALRKAAQLAGVSLKRQEDRELRLSSKERIFIETANHYHNHLSANGGMRYLTEKRGHRAEVLDRMQVGWTDGGLVQYLRAKGFTDDEIRKSGLTKDRSENGNSHLVDYFAKGLAIFPHFANRRVLHFTIKDPQKKLKYQLTNEARSREWRFYHQDALQKYGEVIVVEGENDLLSVMDAGIDHVIGLIGQPADYQIKALKTHCLGKHVYLWLDNDKGGRAYIRQICESLQGSGHNVRVIVYGESAKDPDEYIQAFQGDRRREVRRLQTEALPYLTWEIGQAEKLETLEERIHALKERKVFAAVAGMVEAEKIVYIEKIGALGLSKAAIDELLDVNMELRRDLALYLDSLQNKRDADPNVIALKIFRHFSQHGRFFHDRMHDVYLMYHHHIYEIGSNRPFNALIKKMTSLLPTKEPGRSVWESLASEAYSAGTRIDLASWIHTDRATDTVYVNLNSPNNVILKISKEGIEEIPNGLNSEAVLLKSSKKILPVNFLPDADVKEGMQALNELIFDNLTCEVEQRYLILCWCMSAFLLDFAPYMGLMKFSGATSSGKTTAARLLSLLIYGNDHLGDPSAAAAYAVAAQNPLLIIDNLESEDFTKSILKFLLLSATKGGKEKRTQGTDSDTIEEMPKALVLITAIEPFTKAELINRTYDIDFQFKFKSDGFVEDEVIRALVKKRDHILSAILKLLQREVFPNMAKRREYITILKKEYRNHSKNRTDEFLAMLMVILDVLLKYIPYYGPDDFLFGIESGDKEIRKAWIEYQDAKARETETTSNVIVRLLDGLVREYMAKMQDVQPEPHRGYDEPVWVYTHPEYLVEMVKTQAEVCTDESGDSYTRSYIEFLATTGDMVIAFDRYCRNNGIRNPYDKPSVLAARIRNDSHLFRKAGWELVSREEGSLYYKVVHGNRFFRFRKAVVK